MDWSQCLKVHSKRFKIIEKKRGVKVNLEKYFLVYVQGKSVMYSQLYWNYNNRSQDLLSRTVNDNLAVANWETFTNDLDEIFNRTKSCPLTYEGIEGEFKFSSGKTETCLIPDYIPQLARANKEALAVSVCTVDGQRFHVGDYHTWYSMQSTSKPFFYSIAHALLGDQLHDYVGHEPSGNFYIYITRHSLKVPNKLSN